MGTKFIVVLKDGMKLPERKFWIDQAWGDFPVSYFQDDESLDECNFLDLKVNKWEINSEWSLVQGDAPWIRVEILRGAPLEEYLKGQGVFPLIKGFGELLLVFELDDGGNDLDEILLLRLVIVFWGSGIIYRWDDGFHVVNENAIASLPGIEVVRSRLLRCK